jgi:transposase InsO family protein
MAGFRWTQRQIRSDNGPEFVSRAVDQWAYQQGLECSPDTTVLLKRAHVSAGEIRYVSKETDRKWEEGD